MNRLDARQRRKEMLERHLRGETLEEIGKEFGLSRERVRQIVTCDDGYCSKKRRRESVKVLIQKLHKPGMTLADMARLSGLSPDMVSSIASILGLEFRSGVVRVDVEPQEVAEVYEMIGTVEGTAKHLGICPQICSRILRAAGVNTRKGMGRRPKLIQTPQGLLTIKECAEISGVSKKTIRERLRKGLLVLTPKCEPKPEKKYETLLGMLTVREMSDFTGIEKGTLKRRVWKGVPKEKLLLPLRDPRLDSGKGRRWTEEETKEIMAKLLPDKELALKFGCSEGSISRRRATVKKRLGPCGGNNEKEV